MKLISAAVLLFTTAVLQAQDVVPSVSEGLAQTVALGGGPTNPYVLDYTDVFTNPAHAFTYKDLLYGDVGYNFAQYSASGQYVGVTLAIDNIASGIALGKREGSMFVENSYLPGAAFAGSDYMLTGLANIWGIAQTEPKTPVQVFGAYKVENLTVGAALYRSGWSRVDDRMGMATLTQKYEMSHYQTGLKLGAIYEISPEQKVEGALLARLNSSSVEMNDASTTVNPTSRTYSANGYEFALNIRGFLLLNEKLELIPQGRFGSFTYTP